MGGKRRKGKVPQLGVMGGFSLGAMRGKESLESLFPSYSLSLSLPLFPSFSLIIYLVELAEKKYVPSRGVAFAPPSGRVILQAFSVRVGGVAACRRRRGDAVEVVASRRWSSAVDAAKAATATATATASDASAQDLAINIIVILYRQRPKAGHPCVASLRRQSRGKRRDTNQQEEEEVKFGMSWQRQRRLRHLITFPRIIHTALSYSWDSHPRGKGGKEGKQKRQGRRLNIVVAMVSTVAMVNHSTRPYWLHAGFSEMPDSSWAMSALPGSPKPLMPNAQEKKCQI
jgi:hypothetical protein